MEGSGEAAALRRRHALWCIGFAERSARELSGPDQALWLARLDRDHDNLRAALAWALAGGAAELGLRLATALWYFWHTHGYLSEGREWLERAALAAGAGALHSKAWALNRAGDIVARQGDLGAARGHLEEALSLFRDLGDREGIASTLTLLGVVAVLARIIHGLSLPRVRHRR